MTGHSGTFRAVLALLVALFAALAPAAIATSATNRAAWPDHRSRLPTPTTRPLQLRPPRRIRATSRSSRDRRSRHSAVVDVLIALSGAAKAAEEAGAYTH
jgi:hypothetical protein